MVAKESRVKNSIKNSLFGIIAQISVLLLGFISRKIFINILGTEILGLNGLLSNVLSMLALAELGIGGAITYNLYQPIAFKDEIKISKLMNLYKNTYRGIALIMTFLGILFMFFVQYFIKNSSFELSYIRIIFLLFLFNSVSSYFYSYKFSLIIASQKGYIITAVTMVTNIILIVSRSIILIVFKNFILYLVIGIVFNLIQNYMLSKYIDKKNPYLLEYKKEKLSSKEKGKIFSDVKNLSVHSLASFVVNSTDNILISSFVGLIPLGLFSNYYLIISSVKGFVSQVVLSMKAGLGNLTVEASREEVIVVFNKLNYMCFYIASFCSVSFAILSHDFIKLWLGESYLLQDYTILINVVNFFIWVVIRPLWQLSEVSGLFKEDKYNAIAEMIVNLIFSLAFVLIIGMPGVFLGTTISYVVGWLLKTRLIFNKFLYIPYKGYIKKLIGYGCVTIFEIIALSIIFNFFNFMNPIVLFVLKMLACVTVPNIINIFIYRKTDEYKYFKFITLKIFRRKLA